MSLATSEFLSWVHQVVATYCGLNNEEKNTVLEAIISASEPNQMYFLSTRLTELVYRDFISHLPTEVVINILQYVDGKQLLICCQVSKSWNQRISNLFSLWISLIKSSGTDFSYTDIPVLETLSGDGDELMKPSWRGSDYKDLYRHTLSTLKGFSTGKSININEEFIDKAAWRITSVRYHNGNIVTGCDDHTVQIWSVLDGAMLASISTHSVCCLTIRNRHLYTASFNANAESWDLITGHHHRTFCGHTSAVLAIDVLEDESFLLTGSVDKTAKLWDLRKSDTQLLVKTFDTTHKDWVFKVEFLLSASESNQLLFVTCDSSLCCLWRTDLEGYVLASSHITADVSAKFTSFYRTPRDAHCLYVCQWKEGTKSSSLLEFRIRPKSNSIEQIKCIHIPMEHTKAFLLGAGRKFAVIMCSISRKDFHVIDIPKRSVIATIKTPDFCVLTRNGSTVTLCDTSWLDGFQFSRMTKEVPIFAAGMAQSKVMLGTWDENIAQISKDNTATDFGQTSS